MIGVIICTHSDFAQGLKNAVEMIAGKQDAFDHICFMNGDDAEELSEKIGAFAQPYIDHHQPYCVITDMFAATPFNAALRFAAENGGFVVTGANLPLLLEILMTRDSFEGDDLHLFLNNVLSSVKESMQVINAKEMFE